LDIWLMGMVLSGGCRLTSPFLQHAHQLPEAGIELKVAWIGLLKRDDSIEAYDHHH
jgi:hypothetical protein